MTRVVYRWNVQFCCLFGCFALITQMPVSINSSHYRIEILLTCIRIARLDCSTPNKNESCTVQICIGINCEIDLYWQCKFWTHWCESVRYSRFKGETYSRLLHSVITLTPISPTLSSSYLSLLHFNYCSN